MSTMAGEAEAIVANAPVGILVTRDRRIARYNRKFSEMFGLVGDEGGGMGMSILFPSPEDCDTLDKLADSLFCAGEPLRSEAYLRREDGTVFLAEIMGYACDPDNPGDGIVWIVDDLAERRKAAAKAGAAPVLPAAGIEPGNHDFAGRRNVFPLAHRDGVRLEVVGDGVAASAADPLFSVPGLDAAVGLRRAGGKMAFYRKLLRQFLASQGGAVHDINVALAAANFQLAARLAHALKGCAGNIGATRLAQLAAEVDDTIREIGNGKPTKLRLMRLDAALDEFRTRLAAALGMPETASRAGLPPDRVVAELAARLGRSDGEAADYFDAHADVLRGSLPVSDFETLATAVRHYDFAAALALLGAMRGDGDGGES